MTDAAPASDKRWWPPLVGATVLGIALVVALLPTSSSTSATTDRARPASVPTLVADYSYLTGDVATSPPGRAVALFQHGLGVEFMDFPQAVMVGADADVYRRVGVAEARGGPETQGDPGPMLLSPDGTQVAVGDYDIRQPDLALLDLHTGETELHPVPGGHTIIPLAWSPDSSRLAYLSTATQVDPYMGTAVRGDIGILEPATGQARLLPGVADVRAAAFSPDGNELAIHRISPDDGAQGAMEGIPQLGGGTVDVVGLDDAVRRQLTLPPEQYLDGPNAWSPDGALLATGIHSWGCQQWTDDWDEAEWRRCIEETKATFFVDASGRGVPVPAPLKAGLAGSYGVLGWLGAGEVLVLDDVNDSEETHTDDELYWLTSVPLEGGSPHRLSAVPSGEDYGVGVFQMAAALVPDMQVRGAGTVDRGRWPTALRVGAAVLCAGTALLVAEFVRRRRRRQTSRH